MLRQDSKGCSYDGHREQPLEEAVEVHVEGEAELVCDNLSQSIPHFYVNGGSGPGLGTGQLHKRQAFP